MTPGERSTIVQDRQGTLAQLEAFQQTLPIDPRRDHFLHSVSFHVVKTAPGDEVLETSFLYICTILSGCRFWCLKGGPDGNTCRSGFASSTYSDTPLLR